MREFLWNMLVSIYDFWNSVYLWFQNHPLPSALSFLDPLAADAPVWKTLLIFGAYAVIYILVCLLMVKIAKIPLRMIDNHMQRHNSHAYFNFKLYLTAIALFVLDEIIFGKSESNDGKITVGMFSLVAAALLVIAIFRMMRRAGWRFIYFIPLQVSVFALLYVYALLWAPAVVILLIFGITGASFTARTNGRDHVCPYCGGSISAGVTCACGRSRGSYDGHPYPRSADE